MQFVQGDSQTKCLEGFTVSPEVTLKHLLLLEYTGQLNMHIVHASQCEYASNYGKFTHLCYACDALFT